MFCDYTCKWSHRGHYSVHVPARLHLGGQWDSDLPTWRKATDGWTSTSLSRLVSFSVTWSLWVCLKFFCVWFIYFFAFVFVCLSVPHNVCTHSPHTYIYTIYVYANLFMLCGAWHHSAQVGYSKQHPLMHYLTDCQQSLVQQAPGGKKQLYSNLSRFRVTILLIQVHRLPFAYNQQFYCSG